MLGLYFNGVIGTQAMAATNLLLLLNNKTKLVLYSVPILYIIISFNSPNGRY